MTRSHHRPKPHERELGEIRTMQRAGWALEMIASAKGYLVNELDQFLWRWIGERG